MPVLVAFLILMFVVPAAWAAEKKTDSATLTVSAQGLIQLAPDTAIINLAVETAGESFEAVLGENRSRMERVIDRLLRMGIAEERIQTTSFEITPRYAPPPRRRPGEIVEPKPPNIIGYTVRNTLKVEVRQLDTVGRVVDSALGAGANRFSGIHWRLRDRHKVYLRALGIAARNAREKAGALAKSLDVKLVRLERVQEGAPQVLPAPRSFARTGLAMAESAGSSVPLSPGEMQVAATVTLVFNIQPQ